MKAKYSDYINEIYLYYNFGLKHSNPSFLRFLLIILWCIIAPFFILSHITYSVILLLTPRCKIIKPRAFSGVCIARTFATKNKLEFLKSDGISFFNEAPFSVNDNFNLYSLPFLYRLKSFIFSNILFFFDLIKIAKESSAFVPAEMLFKFIVSYLIRIPHKVNFESYLYQFISYVKPEFLVTGNKEDRFALAEETVAMSNCLELVCYPHGLEYAVRLPRGVVGNKFYCYSDATKKHYDSIYNDKQQVFFFSSLVVSNLLGKKVDISGKSKNLVFFPESRGKNINCMIVKWMIEKKIPFFLKLHPLDSEMHYTELGFDSNRFIQNFDAAISGNIVLARKSTVLLEALYSDSESCAVLIDDEDYESYNSLFPSLWDERIVKHRNFDSLLQWLIERHVIDK